MEHKITHQKSTRKLFNKIFHPSNSKKSTQVSPSSSPPDNNHEWVPAFISTSTAFNNQYEHEKAGNWSSPNSPSALITTHYNGYMTGVAKNNHYETRNKHTVSSPVEFEDYHSDGDDNSSTTGRDSISTSSTDSMPRRCSLSTVHETSRQRLIAAKRAEYQQKMDAFDDLIQRRRGSTLRLAGVTGY